MELSPGRESGGLVILQPRGNAAYLTLRSAGNIHSTGQPLLSQTTTEHTRELPMIKSRLCDLIGIKHPIIQAGMGPFSNNNLGVAAANAGVLGLLSASGVFNKESQPWIYRAFVGTAGADYDDDIPTVMEKVLKRTYNLVKDKGGIFGINVMVSAEVLKYSHVIIDTAIKVREENPDIKKHFKVIFTSAGDPLGWKDKIKGAGFTWMHVVPSVKAALRCQKAGVG